MSRRFSIVDGKLGPAFDDPDTILELRRDRERRLPHTDLVITDFGLYPTRGSDGMREAADAALLIELEASLEVPR